MDHYQIRFPTNVEDVARVLYDLARESRLLRSDLLPAQSQLLPSRIGTLAPRHLATLPPCHHLATTLPPCHPRAASLTRPDLDKPLPPILHYASPAPPMTKYDMTVIIAKHLGLPIEHIKSDAQRPVIKPGQTERPENTSLSTKSLKEIGVDTREELPFDQWWARWIKETKK
jgi:hypothetical protein